MQEMSLADRMRLEAGLPILRKKDAHNTAQNSPKATKTDANGADNNLSTSRPKHGSVGVLVVEDGCILSGIRKSGYAPGLVCGPGGHVEDGETHEQAAIRETQEEFGITPKGLIQLGFGPWEPDTGLKSAVFLATEYEGTLRNTDGEMGDLRFRSLAELQEMSKAMFQPFTDAIEIMQKVVGKNRLDGGPGSENWGHESVPGVRGGSKGGGGKQNRQGSAEKGYTSAAKERGNQKSNSTTPSSDRQPVSHEVVSPKEALVKIQETAKKVAESGKTSYRETKKQMFADTENTGLPQVLSQDEFDKAESDYPAIYRGFQESEQMDQFCNGEAYIGSGFAGSGTNVAVDPEDANDWGGENVLEMKLAKGAKVISEDDFMPIYIQVRDGYDSASAGTGAKFGSSLSSDPGCVAAALGYDAIYSDVNNWFNVLNRSQLIVKQKSNGDSRSDGGPDSIMSVSDLATAFNSAISKNGDNEKKYLDRCLKNDIIKVKTQSTCAEAFQVLAPEDIAFIAEEFGVDVSDATEGELQAVMAMLRMDGGPGSGNHGHKGVKGQRGGSAPKSSESSSSSGEKKAKTAETTVKKFGGTSTKNFVKSLSEAKATVPEESRWRVDTYTEETMDREHPGANLHVTDGGSTVAVTSDGDIISVCHKEGDTQRGRDLLEAAVANGGTKLDAFGPVLYSFYTRNKFEPVSWTPFNKEYAPEGWDASRDSEEPVIFYKYTGKVTSQSYSDFISSTAPCEGDDGYEKAGKLRDESMEG